MASKLSSGVSGTGNTAASAGASGSPSKASTSSTTKSSGSSTSSPKVSASSSLSKGVSGSGKTAASSLSSSGGSSGGSSGTRSSTASSKTTNAITSSMSKSLSDSSSATSRSSSEAAKAATVGKNLRGDSASKALSRLDPATVDKLLTYEALQSNFGTPRATIDPAAEEQSLFDLLQSPYERRVERAGGAPFEGPVDWGGIGAAIFGGQSAADRDAAILAARTPLAPADPSRFDPINPMGGPSWEQFDDYVNNSDAFGTPLVDPKTGFIRDPETGTFYRPDLLPGSETRLAENPVATQQFPSFAPLDGLMQGINAEVARTDGSAMPPLPRPDPRGGIAEMGVNLPGQVEGGRDPVEIEVIGGNGTESDEARYAREHPVQPKKEATVFDKAVEMGGSLLENTALGGIAKNLFPDLWYGTGEAIKGMDDGVTYGGGRPSTDFGSMESGGSLSNPVGGDGGGGGYALPPGFVDLNGNGIDDRLEGYQPSTAPNARVASFPNMPPYNPGRSDEWTYFTNNRLAHGGIVHAYADGGPVAAEDPRMKVIAGAEDVLEKIAAGGKPDERDAAVLKAFVAQFGDGALRSLNDNVKAGMKMGGNSGGRMIEGPGTGTSDSIPALIDGHTPAALSDGEFVMTADAVAGAGGGDPDKGAEALEQLSQRLAGMKAA